MPYLGILGVEFLKNIVIFEISTLEFVKHESLTHTMNFGIGSAFSIVLGPAFLKVRVRVGFIRYATIYLSFFSIGVKYAYLMVVQGGHSFLSNKSQEFSGRF